VEASRLLPGDTVSEAFHRWRWWAWSRIAVTEQRPFSCCGTVLELADDALSDIAHRINRPDHLLLPDHDFIEQAFKLGRYARVDQRRISLLENAEQL